MWAVEARQEAEWDRTANRMALAINLKAGKMIAKARDLNPYKAARRSLQPPTLFDMIDFLEPE